MEVDYGTNHSKDIENRPSCGFLAIMFFVFIPSSCVLMIKKLNRWVKTIVVLVSGEVGAIVLLVLAQAAKTSNTGSVMAEFMPLAIVLAVMILVVVVTGHIFHWENKLLKSIRK